ncbi:MAG: DUF1533 domain-containing protein [Firmicutes bacterium]|nr:DUF1533 domain-containing protein [Bacillota bacterium]
MAKMLCITDKNNVYVPISADFELTVDYMPVKFSDNAIIAATGYSNDDLENFIKNIAVIDVNGTEYESSSVDIILEDGSFNKDEEYSHKGETTAVFNESGEYKIGIKADGYKNKFYFNVNVSR